MTTDQIGQTALELSKVEGDIQHVEFMNSGQTQPELLAAHHQELRELRGKRTQLRADMVTLKTQHKRELLNRLSEINKQIELEQRRKEQEDLQDTVKSINKTITRIEEEIKIYSE